MTIIDEQFIGGQRIILGDCLKVMPELNRFDALVTDPPYGIKQDKGFSGSGGFNNQGSGIARKQYRGDWDSERPTPTAFDLMLNSADNSIIFGGNYFTDLLPVSGHWLVWDKKNTMPSFSDCELAWTNIDKKSVKLLTYEYNGLLGKREKRVHPTQKPVEVMQWAIQKTRNSKTILDPYVGSGTTLVACEKLGLNGTGIEVNKEFYDIACERVFEATREPDLFVPKPEQPKQINIQLQDTSEGA
tara:strand:+ start:395 stop:1126 length:732 start_codon:yes stop_codon:yes gene_type:complete